MRLHDLIKEILVVPPERAAHATDTPVNGPGPAGIARNKAAEGTPKDTQSAPLVKRDS